VGDPKRRKRLRNGSLPLRKPSARERAEQAMLEAEVNVRARRARDQQPYRDRERGK
jgi:hypothetical protein